MQGGPVAIVGRVGASDADDDLPDLAHEVLVLGELAVQRDPRIRTLRDVVRDHLTGVGALRRDLLR
jgi:hypothetical protein